MKGSTFPFLSSLIYEFNKKRELRYKSVLYTEDDSKKAFFKESDLWQYHAIGPRTRARTRAGRTMQKSPKTQATAKIAISHASLTESALIADFMQDAPLCMHKKPKQEHLPRIGIDLMGSDASPADLLSALLLFLQRQDLSAHFHLFGTPDLFKGISFPPAVTPAPANEVICMDDDPLLAIRRKKNSSLCVGIDSLAKREIDAFISAGNTGSLMGYAKLRLPELPGIKRSALVTLLPMRDREIAVLDVGANMTYKAEHLYLFALMGIAYQKSRGIANPTVGLLNIGTEANKGTPELQKAYKKLATLNATTPIFIGNIEGRDVFQKKIDVLITDGFTGNVFLKTAEGIAAVILDQLEETASDNCSPHLKGILDTLRKQLHYSEYPGALLCGVDGIVMKCHGTAPFQSVTRTIVSALRLIKHDFLKIICSQLKS
jgi:glycerol-3-phosphate acyltransferase PlsX